MVNEQKWRRVAACRRLGPAVMILGEKDGADRTENQPTGRCSPQESSAATDRLSTMRGRDQARQAVAACQTCPVAEDCLTHAMHMATTDDLDPWSIYGGHLPGELEQLGHTLEHLAHLGADPGDIDTVIEGRVEWMRTRTL